MTDRIVVKNGVVRFIETGLIPEDYDLTDMLEERKITTKEFEITKETRAWEMIEV